MKLKNKISGEIKELRKKLKEEKRQLRDAKILFWQAGGGE